MHNNIMKTYCSVSAQNLEPHARVSGLEFNVPFQHKHTAISETSRTQEFDCISLWHKSRIKINRIAKIRLRSEQNRIATSKNRFAKYLNQIQKLLKSRFKSNRNLIFPITAGRMPKVGGNFCYIAYEMKSKSQMKSKFSQNYCFSLGVAWHYNWERILDPRINILLQI